MNHTLSKRFVEAVQQIADALTVKKVEAEDEAMKSDKDLQEALNSRHLFLLATYLPPRTPEQRDQMDAMEKESIARVTRARTAAKSKAKL